jgi:hypothetical protein
MVRGTTRDWAIRTRFFGLRLVEEVSSERAMLDKNCSQQSD